MTCSTGNPEHFLIGEQDDLVISVSYSLLKPHRHWGVSVSKTHFIPIGLVTSSGKL